MHARCVALAPAGPTVIDNGAPSLATRAKSISSVCRVRRESKAFDVVIAYGSSTLPVAVLALAGRNVKVIYRSIGDPRFWAGGRARRFRTGLMLRRVDRVVALWDGAAQAIADLYGVKRNRILVIPNARHGRDFGLPSGPQRAASRSSFGVQPDGPVILVLGALSSEKAVDRAIRAAALLPAAFLLIVGDGPARAELETLSNRLLPGRHRLVGGLQDVGPALCAANVLVLTSKSEGMPGSLIEAGFSGLPVVAVDVGAVSWLFDNGLRGEVVPRDAEDSVLAEAIERTLAMPRSGSALRQCDWPTVGDKWSLLLRSICDA